MKLRIGCFHRICGLEQISYGYDKDIAASEDIEHKVKDNRKQHLNVVFIGHVGWLIFFDRSKCLVIKVGHAIHILC